MLWGFSSFIKQISDNRRVRILNFFVAEIAKKKIPQFNIRLYDKKKQLRIRLFYFFSTKIRIFFSGTLGIRIFFLEKNHRKPPHPLEVKWSVHKRILYPFFHEYFYNVIGFSKTCRWTNRLLSRMGRLWSRIWWH